MRGLPPDSISEQNEDVLQNIEAVVIRFYHRHSDLTDYNVNKVYEGLERTYKASTVGRTPPTLRFSPLEQSLYDNVKAVCEWRMGRGDAPKGWALAGGEVRTIDIIVMIACLKRLQKSIKLWTAENGMRGYLNYVGQFLP